MSSRIGSMISFCPQLARSAHRLFIACHTDGGRYGVTRHGSKAAITAAAIVMLIVVEACMSNSSLRLITRWKAPQVMSQGSAAVGFKHQSARPFLGRGSRLLPYRILVLANPTFLHYDDATFVVVATGTSTNRRGVSLFCRSMGCFPQECFRWQ